MNVGSREVGEELWSDVIVVGAGAAGLTAALGAADRGVTLLAKAPLGEGAATGWAQGGVAAAVGSDDSPALHAADTVAAGAGLCDPTSVERLVESGPEAIERLLALGTRLDRASDGSLAAGQEAAHQRRRVLHAADATGREILRALVEAVRREPRVRTFAPAHAEALVLAAGRVVGVLARHDDGRRVLHRGRAVVLATGGIGRLYRHTTNPPEASGDGLVLAARAGAVLADLEFVQFHPTALAAGADPLPLLTEALRGEGAVLVDERGVRFMVDEHPLAELAPRDVVSRAIWWQLEAGRRVFLDAREAVGSRFAERFPTVLAACLAAGIDPRLVPMPVAPAAHYHMGGIATDGEGRTSLPGLWAAGEVASTGVHGANRLASNSLLEALVFGARVARDLAHAELAAVARREALPELPQGPAASGEREAELRDLMWRRVGLVRDGQGLAEAVERLAREVTPAPPGSLGAFATAGWLIAAAAGARQESRGGHFRCDFPATDARLAQRSFAVAELDGAYPRLRPLGRSDRDETAVAQ
ncbi:MAG: L-aspartate oxidase [Holophagales bacterium]|nr:MAG: L-aspartate oxidase [Holophagales bacterium]